VRRPSPLRGGHPRKRWTVRFADGQLRFPRRHAASLAADTAATTKLCIRQGYFYSNIIYLRVGGAQARVVFLAKALESGGCFGQI
jgi:hypothetical protein